MQKPLYKEPCLYIILSLIIATIITPKCTTYPQTVKNEFRAEFGDHSDVYDGDTWTDIYISVKTLEHDHYLPEVLWPGILLIDDTLYVVTDIRLKGIDTPEKRPTKAGRTPESLAREKAAAQLAKNAVEELLEENDWEFVVTEPELGKYAGRTVANILIGKERINLTEYLINKGLGYEYGGGKKKAFDTWYTGAK